MAPLPVGLPDGDRGRRGVRGELLRVHRRPPGEHVPPAVLLALPPPLLPRGDGAGRRRVPHPGQGKHSDFRVLLTLLGNNHH